jgi:bleomycin hydrolase
MDDGWFNDHVYQIIMPKADLDPNHQTALNSDPVMLPLWHPMG